MSVNMQIRNVPDAVHRRLKAQAAMAGQSLNEFLLARMHEIASTPTAGELAERIRARGKMSCPSAGVLRTERDRR